MWILGFSELAKPITQLWKKMAPSFGEKSKTTHYIAVGIILSQIDDEGKDVLHDMVHYL
jgi:hypothetical protein